LKVLRRSRRAPEPYRWAASLTTHWTKGKDGWKQ